MEAWQLVSKAVIAFGISYATTSQRGMSLEDSVEQLTPYTCTET